MFPVKLASLSEYKLELHTSPIGKPHVFIDTNAERPKRRPVNSKGGVHMWNCQKDFTQRMDAGVANHFKAFNDFLQLGISCQSKKPPPHRCQLCPESAELFQRDSQCSGQAKKKKAPKCRGVCRVWSVGGLEIRREFSSTSRCMSLVRPICGCCPLVRYD